MVGLDGKVIKRAYIHRYRMTIQPEELVDDYGMERTPQDLRYFMVMDQNAFAYLIPAKTENGVVVKCYEPEDIVEAALGTFEKKNLIDEVHKQVRLAFYNSRMFNDEWLQDIFDDTIETFVNQYNARLTEKNLPVAPRENFPKSPKTYSNLTKQEIEIILANAIYPPTPKSSPFLGN